MITASHNPAADDGYKIYWENACQIIPPHDSGISRCIQANLQPWVDYSSISSITVEDITEEAIRKYMNHATSCLHANSADVNSVVYQ